MIPRRYQLMHKSYPDLMRAYESFGQAAREAGPLSDREVALVKLAISLGAALEGAAHSHCRKAIEAGCSAEDLRHVAILTGPTTGFPAMMRAKSWIEDMITQANGPAEPGPQAPMQS